jgi:uncharacterized protein (TIGR02246 family)
MPHRPKAYAFPAEDREVRAIADLVAGLQDAQNDHDAARFDRQFTADALFVTASGTRLLGWDEMYAHHKKSLDRADSSVRVRFTVLSVNFLSSDVAIAHTRQEYVSEAGASNHGTAVLTKRDGTWWICAMQHTNLSVNGG